MAMTHALSFTTHTPVLPAVAATLRHAQGKDSMQIQR